MNIVPNQAPEIVPYMYNVACSVLPDGTYITFESVPNFDGLIQTLKFIRVAKNAQEIVYVSTATDQEISILNTK